MEPSNSSISDRSLGELLGNSLTSTPCANVRKDARVKVVSGMLSQYLESFTDSVVVRDMTTPIGVVGGREIIQGVFKNPTSDFFELNFVEDIADKRLKVISADLSLKKLISIWKEVKRAFALINLGNDDYSVISAKKLMEIGANYESDFHISEIPKKKIVTLNQGATFGDAIKLMLENKSRKIILHETNQFINDRIIIESIEKFNFLLNQRNFLDIPLGSVALEEVLKINEDLTLSEISKIMYNRSHPLVIYEESVITPWDICLALEKI